MKVIVKFIFFPKQQTKPLQVSSLRPQVNWAEKYWRPKKTEVGVKTRNGFRKKQRKTNNVKLTKTNRLSIKKANI